MKSFREWAEEIFTKEFLENAEKEYRKIENDSQFFREVFEERAAIMEYDGGMKRKEAEEAAFKEVYGFSRPEG